MSNLKNRVLAAERNISGEIPAQVIFTYRPWRGDDTQPLYIQHGDITWRQEVSESLEAFKARCIKCASSMFKPVGPSNFLYLDARHPSLTQNQWLAKFNPAALAAI